MYRTWEQTIDQALQDNFGFFETTLATDKKVNLQSLAEDVDYEEVHEKVDLQLENN